MDFQLAVIMAAEMVPMKFEPRSKPLRAIGSTVENLKSIFKVRNQRDEIWILVTAIEEVAKKLTDSTGSHAYRSEAIEQVKHARAGNHKPRHLKFALTRILHSFEDRLRNRSRDV